MAKIETSSLGLEPEATYVFSFGHALLVIDLAVGKGGHQSQVELAYFRVLHGEVVKNAVVRFDRGRVPARLEGGGVIAQLLHDLGELFDFLLPDFELAVQAAHGDTGAFETIMRRHNQLLFRTARSILKSDEEAEDAVQEAYLNAWRALGTFRADARLSTWLVRIVLNEALGRVRKRARNVVPLDMVGGTLMLDPEFVMEADRDEQPDRLATRAQMRRVMEARIHALPEVFRTVFVLRAVQELTVEEVAASMGIPDATVRTRFFRARAMLRESLSREVDFAREEVAVRRCDRDYVSC